MTSVKEKIKQRIEDLLDQMDEASPRECTALASAVKELYIALEYEGTGSASDWLSQLRQTELEPKENDRY